MENSKFMSRDIERDLTCVSFHVSNYSFSLQSRHFEIPLNIHDAREENKKRKRKKRDCTKKRVTSGSFSMRLHRAIK